MSGSGWEAVRRALLRRLRAAREIYEGVYVAPWRAAAARQARKERDLFFLLAFSDMLGVPSPLTFYTLELLPELLERYHEWHRRMGMERAPEGGFRCC